MTTGGFFTGRYPHSHRNRVNYTPLDRGEILIQKRLQNAGYATAAVGKLHYHPPNVAEAKRTGFDHVELHDAVPQLDRYSDYVAWRNLNDPDSHIGYRAIAKDIPEGKNCFFEASIRVPLIIRYHGKVKTGNYQQLVESVDLLPTLFELAGLPEPYSNQGRSLVSLISDGGNYVPRGAVFAENIIPEVITGGRDEFEFIKGKGIRGTRHPDAKMVRTRRWKYIYYPEGYSELYDLKSDPREMVNLAQDPAHREQLYEMKDRLLHWLTTADEPDQIAPRWLRPTLDSHRRGPTATKSKSRVP